MSKSRLVYKVVKFNHFSARADHRNAVHYLQNAFVEAADNSRLFCFSTLAAAKKFRSVAEGEQIFQARAEGISKPTKIPQYEEVIRPFWRARQNKKNPAKDKAVKKSASQPLMNPPAGTLFAKRIMLLDRVY